jgi:hypothetical protein
MFKTEYSHSSVSPSNRRMLSAMTTMPSKATTVKANDNQTSAMDAVPISPTTLFPCTVVEMMATTDAAATCCHSAEIIKSSEAVPSAHMTALVTGREGNGLMSMSEPVRASRSSCHPGKLANPRKPKAVRARAPILRLGQY